MATFCADVELYSVMQTFSRSRLLETSVGELEIYPGTPGYEQFRTIPLITWYLAPHYADIEFEGGLITMISEVRCDEEDTEE